MATTLADRVARAADHARRRALSFPGSVSKDALLWSVIEVFDADTRGNVERDRRIEDVRDRVLVTAVNLAETSPDMPNEVAAVPGHLVDAIDYLEQTALRFGIVNRQGGKRSRR